MGFLTIHLFVLFILMQTSNGRDFAREIGGWGKVIETQPPIIEDGIKTGDIFLIGKIGRKTYFVGKDMVRYGEALDFCQNYDLELASIKSPEENQFVNEYQMKNDKDFFWLSASDLFNEGNWRWLQGSIRVQYSNWMRGETFIPNKKYNCSYIKKSGFWYTAKCGRENNYPLCEMIDS